MLVLNKLEFSHNLSRTLQHVSQLPPLPETTQQLLKLRNDPDANIERLTSLIEKDPSLTAFIMKYARMSIFGYGDRISSVHHAITLVLGFNTALNLTLCTISAGCFKLPNDGALGRVRIWSQALACATLGSELCQKMANKDLINCDLAYLNGLFHNFGHLLFGHLYPREFSFLNNLVSRHPELNARALQLHTFGIAYDTIGMYLIKAWNLPEEIMTAVAEQHFPDYSGNHAAYVKLIAVAKRLLSNQPNPDGCSNVATAALLDELGISESDAKLAQERICGSQNEFLVIAEEISD
ncbi:MAG: HDOD domain-containing protein [Nitrosomonas sp.]|nr:HDOD domain-containing protein [Nitrosomonas sp.]